MPCPWPRLQVLTELNPPSDRTPPLSDGSSCSNGLSSSVVLGQHVSQSPSNGVVLLEPPPPPASATAPLGERA